MLAVATSLMHLKVDDRWCFRDAQNSHEHFHQDPCWTDQPRVWCLNVNMSRMNFSEYSNIHREQNGLPRLQAAGNNIIEWSKYFATIRNSQPLMAGQSKHLPQSKSTFGMQKVFQHSKCLHAAKVNIGKKINENCSLRVDLNKPIWSGSF